MHLKESPLPKPSVSDHWTMKNEKASILDFLFRYLNFHDKSYDSVMAYSTKLAERIRTYLEALPNLKVEEKEMFSGLAFLVNGKMCINVSEDELMCRYDPLRDDEVAERAGFQPMIMKGKQLRGYCYVSEDGYKSKANFEYWLKLCLGFNEKAKVSRKKKKS